MKKKIIISLIVIIICLSFIFVLSLFKKDKIPDNYMFVFYGQENKTYIYKIDNNTPNMGFKYINTHNDKITSRGELTWPDDVFVEAKKNNAYDYVMSGNQKYSIDDFMGMFLMN